MVIDSQSSPSRWEWRQWDVCVRLRVAGTWLQSRNDYWARNRRAEASGCIWKHSTQINMHTVCLTPLLFYLFHFLINVSNRFSPLPMGFTVFSSRTVNQWIHLIPADTSVTDSFPALIKTNWLVHIHKKIIEDFTKMRGNGKRKKWNSATNKQINEDVSKRKWIFMFNVCFGFGQDFTIWYISQYMRHDTGITKTNTAIYWFFSTGLSTSQHNLTDRNSTCTL